MTKKNSPTTKTRILELLAKDGPKTAAEMRQSLQLSKSALYSGLLPLVNEQIVLRLPHAVHEIIRYGLNERRPREEPVQPEKKPDNTSADTSAYCDAFWNAFLRKVDIPQPKDK